MERAPSPPLLFLLLCSLAVICSAVEVVPIVSKPDVAPESFPINYIQEVGSCSYEVTVTTSCSSPPFISGEIGVLFGDSHGNQIIEKRLSNGDEVFDSCNTDSFVLKDRPCSVQISYMYIYKDGADDWLPNSVEISGSGLRTFQFIYKSSIPRNTWFGFDLRHYTLPSLSSNPFPSLPWLSSPPPSKPLLLPPELILPPPEHILPPPSPPKPYFPQPPPEHILPPPSPPKPYFPQPPPEHILPPPSPPKPYFPQPPPEHILPPPSPPKPVFPAPPPEHILPPPSPPKPVFPPPPPPPSSSRKISGLKLAVVSAILGLLPVALL